MSSEKRKVKNEKWEMVKLGEVCTPKQWKTISTAELAGNGYPVYGANGVIGHFDSYTHEKATLLVTCRGATCGSLNICTPFSYVNGNAMALDNMKENININFLFYYLKNRGFDDVISGSAQPQIIRSSMQKINIPLPPLETQKQIADELDKITGLIEKRKEQLEKLDLFVKAKFVEMFGDPVVNPMGWEKVKLNKVTLKITDGKHGGCSILNEDTGYFFIGAREVNDGKINYLNAPNISKEEFEKDYKRCNIENGDFIIVNTGATIGKNAVLNNENTTKTLLQKSVALIKPEKEKLSSVYLKWCYTLDTTMYQVTSASAQPNLLLSRIKETRIMIPPLHLQNQFADFVAQVDKSKIEIKQSLEKLETLKNALMQEYFG